jgi:hypothetical protein
MEYMEWGKTGSGGLDDVMEDFRRTIFRSRLMMGMRTIWRIGLLLLLLSLWDDVWIELTFRRLSER